MPEVELITQQTAPLLVADMFAESDPGPIAAALSQVPELAVAGLPFLGKALTPGCVDLRRKEIAILRTSALLECKYCVAAHTVVAHNSGLNDLEVKALRNELPVPEAFEDPADRALLAWIDAVAGGVGAVPSQLSQAIKAVTPDHELVELATTIGVTMLLNRFCTALGLPSSAETIEALANLGYENLGYENLGNEART